MGVLFTHDVDADVSAGVGNVVFTVSDVYNNVSTVDSISVVSSYHMKQNSSLYNLQVIKEGMYNKMSFKFDILTNFLCLFKKTAVNYKGSFCI